MPRKPVTSFAIRERSWVKTIRFLKRQEDKYYLPLSFSRIFAGRSNGRLNAAA
jgi:hypothetical protein